MQPTSVRWRDLSFDTGQDAAYRITAIDGWEGRPPPRYEKRDRARAHGTYPTPVWAEERTVTVEGRTWTEAERDALFTELDARLTFDGGPEPLTVAVAGRTLTAAAQLLRFDPMIVRGEWGAGRFGWLMQWRCPDPLRYGPEVTVSTGLPTQGGGLTYPLTYPLTYGELGDTGQLTLTNPGTAAAPILFRLRGELPAGAEISAAGQQLTYAAPIPPGQEITLNTDSGEVLVEGTSSRRGNLSRADWMRVPARSTLTVQFTSLAGAYDPAARLSATVAGAYW